MSEKKLILASSSPRRKVLLEQMGITPDKIVISDIDETAKKNELPRVLALRLAEEKASAIHVSHKDNIILAADTVVACGRRILPKAETKEDFDFCMKLLSGRRHTVVTAIATIDLLGKKRTKAVVSKVKVKRLTEKEISSFYQTMEWQGKAGGYAIQGYFQQFIIWISGSVSGIVGLPMYETINILKASGYKTH